MYVDFSIIINPFDHIYWIINQPEIKESIKEIFGWITFLFGVREMLLFTQKGFKKEPLLVLISKFSLILSASVTRPGVFVISQLAYLFFDKNDIEALFGPYTIFVMNPWHPRHIVSFIALLLALPLAMQTICDVLKANNQEVESENWNKSLRLMTLFNTFASRPILHIGNRLSGYLIRG